MSVTLGYEIRIKEVLDEKWAAYFAPFTLTAETNETILRGVAPEVISPLVSTYGAEMAALMTPALIFSALPGSLAEELGWRGFALPRLQAKTSPLVASLIIGLVWGVWHLPLLVYFGEFRPDDFASMAVMVLNIIPMAILYTWLYNHTRGSLLLVTLFHLSQQFSNNFLGTWPTMTDEIITWALALVVFVFWWKQKEAVTKL